MLLYDASFTEIKTHNLTSELLKVEGPFKAFIVTGIVYNFREILSMEELPDIPLPGEATLPSDPTSPPDSTSTQPPSKEGLGPGAIAGVVVGALVAVVLIVVALVLCLRRRKQRSREPTAYDVYSGPDNTLSPTSYEKSYNFGPYPPSLSHGVLAAQNQSLSSNSTSNLNDLQPVRSSYPTALNDHRSYSSPLNHNDRNGESYSSLLGSHPLVTSQYNANAHPAAGGNAQLVNLVVDLLNTHYESLNQPPAYPASSAAPSVNGSADGSR